MWFHGVDFSSAPSRKKPIVIASGIDDVCSRLSSLYSLDEFENWLNRAEGLIGIDAPFGYPQELCNEVFGAQDWGTVASNLSSIKASDRLLPLAQKIARFRDQRAAGSKEPKRLTDRDSSAFSSMKFFQPPVGRMAARIMPILLRCPHSVLPVRPRECHTTVVEVFPGKKVKQEGFRGSYKGKGGSEETRKRLIALLNLQMSDEILETAVCDSEGDTVDAVIAFHQVREWHLRGWPMSSEIVTCLEGWII